jgi:hypothetical protein
MGRLYLVVGRLYLARVLVLPLLSIHSLVLAAVPLAVGGCMHAGLAVTTSKCVGGATSAGCPSVCPTQSRPALLTGLNPSDATRAWRFPHMRQSVCVFRRDRTSTEFCM